MVYTVQRTLLDGGFEFKRAECANKWPAPRTGIRLGERSDPEQRGVPALIVL